MTRPSSASRADGRRRAPGTASRRAAAAVAQPPAAEAGWAAVTCQVRSLAGEELGRIGTRAVPVLIRLAPDDRSRQRLALAAMRRGERAVFLSMPGAAPIPGVAHLAAGRKVEVLATLLRHAPPLGPTTLIERHPCAAAADIGAGLYVFRWRGLMLHGPEARMGRRVFAGPASAAELVELGGLELNALERFVAHLIEEGCFTLPDGRRGARRRCDRGTP